jgi:hypothetical protein
MDRALAPCRTNRAIYPSVRVSLLQKLAERIFDPMQRIENGGI